MSGEIWNRRDDPGLVRVSTVGTVGGEPPERTYRCHPCLDTGFVLRTPPRYRSIVDPERWIENTAGYAFAFSCEECARGIAIEAGDWAKRTKPRKGEPVNREIARAFDERLRAHPHGDQLRQRVGELLGKSGEDES